MAAARWLPGTIAWLLVALPVAAPQDAAAKSEVATIKEQLGSEDRVTRVYGAIAARHFARREWGFNLLNRPALQDWQRALAPAVGLLIDLLGDEAGLEWIDENGNSEQVTSPSREATQALLALERASIGPLIAALDRAELAGKADGILRQLTRGGPPEKTRAAWQRWWSQNEREALPNERGQFWLIVGGLLLLGAGVALVIWRQNRIREGTSPLRAAWRGANPPAARPAPARSGE